MAITLLGQAMPASMSTVGTLTFPYGEIHGYGGLDQPIRSKVRIATWEWVRLDNAEFDYLQTTVLAAQDWDRGSVTIYDPTRGRIERTFANAVVVMPLYEKYVGGLYHNVTLEIRGIVDI